MTRGQMRVNDISVITGARLVGFGYQITGLAGLSTEFGGRFSNAIRSNVFRQVVLHPDDTAIFSQLVGGKATRSWQRNAAMNLVYRSGALAQTAIQGDQREVQ